MIWWATLPGTDAFSGAAAAAQAGRSRCTAGLTANVFLCTTFTADADFTRLAADISALTGDSHATLRCADLVCGATVTMTLARSRAAPLLRTGAPLPAAGATALVLGGTAHLVNAAGVRGTALGAAD